MSAQIRYSGIIASRRTGLKIKIRYRRRQRALTCAFCVRARDRRGDYLDLVMNWKRAVDIREHH
jgi:hypothetical protein